jgi:hypothetical protein
MAMVLRSVGVLVSVGTYKENSRVNLIIPKFMELKYYFSVQNRYHLNLVREENHSSLLLGFADH